MAKRNDNLDKFDKPERQTALQDVRIINACKLWGGGIKLPVFEM